MTTWDKIATSSRRTTVELDLREMADLQCDPRIVPYLTPEIVKAVSDGAPFQFLGHKVVVRYQ